MFWKKIEKTLKVLLLTLLLIPNVVFAYSEYIYSGGENVGIEVKADGVIIVGTYKIGTIDPASNAGLKIGDMIKSIDNNKITNINDLTETISNSIFDNVKIGYIRNEKLQYTNLKLEKTESGYKTGLYVKDSITGIGTLTYIDPETKMFGALGHEIIEKNSGKILNIDSGTIFHSEVVGIEPSENGVPGEKKAKYFSNLVLGNISENTNKGIFGKYTSTISNKKLYKVAEIDNVKKGEAKIQTVINGSTIIDYGINITNINKSSKTKNIAFEIIDDNLITKTGGIVQGMSGSPIVQGDYIIGAVTHVVVDNPIKGYGIFIVNMLEEAEN